MRPLRASGISQSLLTTNGHQKPFSDGNSARRVPSHTCRIDRGIPRFGGGARYHVVGGCVRLLDGVWLCDQQLEHQRPSAVAKLLPSKAEGRETKQRPLEVSS